MNTKLKINQQDQHDQYKKIDEKTIEIIQTNQTIQLKLSIKIKAKSEKVDQRQIVKKESNLRRITRSISKPWRN